MKLSSKVNVEISDLYWKNLEKILNAIGVSMMDFAVLTTSTSLGAKNKVEKDIGNRFSRIYYRTDMNALKKLIDSFAIDPEVIDVAIRYWNEVNDCYRKYYPTDKFVL
nr:MAG TPA: hypothetical protein [Caudoviricetes sp.]